MAALFDQKPRGYLSIAHRLRQLVAHQVSEKTFSIESAVPLPDQGASLFAALEARYGSALDKRYSVQPALIGGIRIRKGSTVWDGSISQKLQTLEATIG